MSAVISQRHSDTGSAKNVKQSSDELTPGLCKPLYHFPISKLNVQGGQKECCYFCLSLSGFSQESFLQKSNLGAEKRSSGSDVCFFLNYVDMTKRKKNICSYSILTCFHDINLFKRPQQSFTFNFNGFH